MSRTKKIILVIIISLLSILILNTKSFADGYKNSASEYGYVGSTLTLTDFSANRNIVCLNHAQEVAGGGTYIIQAKINIEANNANGHYNDNQNHTKEATDLASKQNGILAYTLSDNGHPKRTQYGFEASDSFCMNMWREMYYWKTAEANDGRILGKAFNVNNVIGTIRDPYKHGDYMPFNETLQEEAEEYADSIGTWITNSAKNTTIKKTNAIAESGDQITLIGPFQFNFAPGMEIDNSSNSKMIQIKWDGGESTSGYIYHADGTRSSLTSLKPKQTFYLRVPSEIKGKISVTLYLNSKTQGRCVDLVIFKSTSSRQGLMAYYPYRKTIYHHQTFNFNIDTENLIIQKLDKDTGKPLQGAKFIFQKVGSPYDKYYIKESNGKISYTKNESEATIFTTNEDGIIEISGLNTGSTYKVIEKEAPQGYIKDSVIPNVEMGYNYTWDAIKSITYLGNNLYYDNLSGNKQLKDYINTLTYVIAGENYGVDSKEVSGIINDLVASGYYNTIINADNPGETDAKNFANRYNLLSYIIQYLINEKGYGVVNMTDESDVKEKLNNIYRRMREKTGQTIVNMPASMQESYWKQWDKQANVRVIYNTSYSAGLIIKKYAEGTTIGLANAKFIVCTDIGCTDVVASGTTSSTGIITISGLQPGTYYVKETQPPSGYELSTNNIQKVTIVAGKDEKVELVFENARKQQPTGEGIMKVIAKSNNTPLEGIEFGVKDWVPENTEYMQYREEPENTQQNQEEHANWENWKKYYDYWKKSQTEFVGRGITGEDGLLKITLDDPSIVEPGTYTLYEIGSNNPYFDVQIDSIEENGIEIGKGYQINGEMVYNDSAEKYIENERTYVDIQGIVFLDVDPGDKKSQGDGLYTDGEGINGVKVTLKRNGTVIDTIESGKDSKGNTLQEGEYKFWGDKNNLKIETKYLDEYVVEFEYNGMKYQSIASDIVMQNINSDKGSKAVDIVDSRNKLNEIYSTISSNSEINYNKYPDSFKSEINYGNNDIYEENSNYNVIGSTSGIYKLSQGYNVIYNEIQNVNFGIEEREQPDLALVKDLVNVRLEIKGKGDTYNYQTRTNDAIAENKDLFKEVGVKFQEKYSNYEYSTPIFESDYMYKSENESEELKAYLTYKITIKNQSTNLISQIDSIVDYYDDRFVDDSATINGIIIGTELDETGKVIRDNNIKFSENVEKYNDKYKRFTISPNLKISSQEEKTIYIQFTLGRSAIETVISDDENENLLENVAEILEYTTFEADGYTKRAGVDVDSKPGNAIPGDIGTYEDDTDRAPTLKLVEVPDRIIAGKVFMDESSEDPESLKTNQERKGSGIYEEGEKGIENVQISLIEKKSGEEEIVQTVSTNEHGDYEIKGYTPGTYYLRFTWGNKSYYESDTGEKIYTTVQDYKGTIYDESRINEGTDWYKNNDTTRYSDALDNIEIRKNIDGQTTNITYELKKELEDTINENYNGELITQMISDTPLMEITIEKSSEGNTVQNNSCIIQNVDFGIAQRPKQALELQKRVKHVQMKLSNGVTLIDAEIDEGGNIKGAPSYIQYFDEKANDPMVKVEISDEIAQNVDTVITYELKINNISEVDYSNDDYYLYGTNQNDENKVKLSPKQIIDYIDNDLLIKESENTNLEIVKDKEELLNKYLTKDVNQVLKNIDNVVISKSDSKTVPEESLVLQIKTYTNLSSNEGVDLENFAEIIEVEKTWGSTLITTPGNYVPGNSSTEEYDNDESEHFVLTEPQGISHYYIPYFIIGICSLGVLASGVIIIKKYVLK